MNSKRKVFVVPYFGELPGHFQLWLNSCEANGGFVWVLFTDCNTSNFSFPPNVTVINTTLAEIRAIFSSKFDREVSLNSAYKLCDFRPVYWLILDFFKIEYDFWGYCDVDLLFGDLAKFISEDFFEQYDRIYSFGHLSLISSSQVSKYAFLMRGADFSWEEVFFDDRNFGFDERHGINRIWEKQNLLFYENEKDFVDIDPQFSELRFTFLPLNRKGQFFFYFDGKVFQGFEKRRKLIFREFSYIHFQKRQMPIRQMTDKYNCILFGIDHIKLLMISSIKDERLVKMAKYSDKGWRFRLKKIRVWLRFIKNWTR